MIERRTWRALVALVFGHRERAIILDALGVGGAADWRAAASLAGLVEHATLVEGGLALLESVLRAELATPSACLPEPSPLALASAWEWTRRASGREAAALLLLVASTKGQAMRRLEQRILEDLEARAWEAVRAPLPARVAQRLMPMIMRAQIGP